MRLKTFWRYYGGKNGAAKIYPQPEHDTIIEPFAGAAGYSCHYPDRQIILIDKSPIIAGIWRYLIHVSEEEIRSIPDVPEGGTVADLNLCQEQAWLVGFRIAEGSQAPRNKPSPRALEKGAPEARAYRPGAGWSETVRNNIASQLRHIRHWRIICGDYTDAPDIEATWFVDPPYSNKAGATYPYQPSSFDSLGEWCRARQGLAMVCENSGADWLEFRPLRKINNTNNAGSKEVIWLNRPPRYWGGVQTALFGGA